MSIFNLIVLIMYKSDDHTYNSIFRPNLVPAHQSITRKVRKQSDDSN